MKRLLALGAIAATGLLFAGCGASPSTQPGYQPIRDNVSVVRYNVGGDELVCVIIRFGSGRESYGGPSCDWARWDGNISKENLFEPSDYINPLLK